MFGYFGRGEVPGRYVRTDRYCYVEWTDRESDTVRARELYDHGGDPQESVNRTNHDAYPSTVDSLARFSVDGRTYAPDPAGARVDRLSVEYLMHESRIGFGGGPCAEEHATAFSVVVACSFQVSQLIDAVFYS